MRFPLRLGVLAVALGVVLAFAVTHISRSERAAAAVHVLRPARPFVLAIHGGGWHEVGPGAVARMNPDVARLRSWGYGVVNVRYRPWQQAFSDVLAAYDQLRRRVGVSTPICTWGASAGAQMALMLAIRRPSVACVVSHAAPTLLRDLRPVLRGHAERAFSGAGGLARWSPALYSIHTPALIEQASDDALLKRVNATEMHARASASRLVILRPGSVPWTHASVNARQLVAVHRLEREFLRSAISRWRAQGPSPPAHFLG